MFHCGLYSLQRKCSLAFSYQPSLLGRFFLGIGGGFFLFGWLFLVFFVPYWSEDGLFSVCHVQGMTGSELARASW